MHASARRQRPSKGGYLADRPVQHRGVAGEESRFPYGDKLEAVLIASEASGRLVSVNWEGLRTAQPKAPSVQYLIGCRATGVAHDMEAASLTKFTVIKVGNALSVDDLMKKRAPRGRKPNLRDEDLAKLVNEVSAGPQSQVIPWEFEGKIATARLAASRVIKSMDAHVFVSSRPDYPGQLLFSRVPLSGRQGRRG